MDLPECYRFFNLAPDAAPADAKQAYRILIKQWHPDQYLNDPDLQQTAHEKTKEINSAYTSISSFMDANPDPIDRRLLLTEPLQPTPEQQPSRTGTTYTYAFVGLLLVVVGGVLLFLSLDVFGAKPSISVANQEASSAAMRYIHPEKSKTKQTASPSPLSFSGSSKPNPNPADPLKF